MNRWAVILTVAVACGSLAGVQAQREGAAATPTFASDVAPILYKHCTTCHRPGEIGPMPLITYDQVRPWAKSIRNQVSAGTMPPWHADAPPGKFVNDRRLSAEEKDTIVRWASNGAPKGNLADLPPVPEYPVGWTIGKPDAIVSMETAFRVPSEGEIKYQYFEAPTNFAEDKWVQAMEVRPGSRAHVHHVLVFAREPNMSPRPVPIRPIQYPAPPPRTPGAPRPPQTGNNPVRRGPLLAQTAQGTNATILAPGTAILLKAGTILTFQIHYTSNGQASTDRTSIGFVFAKEPPQTEIRALALTNMRFAIPPGASDHPVPSGFEALTDITVYRLAPHTHLRGKAWEYRVTYPDGRSEVVLSVPNYDFAWQTDYVFAEPLKLPKGAKLEAVARYDNSKANKSNPDPRAEVRWGDQTWEEMQYTGLMYSIDTPMTTREGR